MQLMPQTAKLMAGASKVKYDVSRLISDPSYNVTLGTAFLAQLLSGYDGSYVLSLAAYNAGPGRVKQWIKDFGDPRNKAADPIDWVERVPFTETRQYIQRILDSTQLYRCRFEIEQDTVPDRGGFAPGPPRQNPRFCRIWREQRIGTGPMNFSESGSENESRFESEDITYRSHDDLLLYARKYGSDVRSGRPLICLAGLTRNGRDFHDLAVTLSTHPTHAQDRILPRLQGARALGMGQRLAQLFRLCRGARRCLVPDASQPRQCRRARHVARRHHHDAAGRDAALRVRMRRHERHRSRHRNRGACPHHGLRRQNPSACRTGTRRRASSERSTCASSPPWTTMDG